MSRNKLNLDALLLKIANKSIKETLSKTEEALRRNVVGVSARSIMKEAEEEEGDSKESKTEKFEIPDEIKFTMIRDLIDSIRAGRSMKDTEIKMNLVNYYDKLDEPERIAMYKYLYAISDILTAGVAWQNAPDPSDNPGSVKTIDKDPDVKAPDPKKSDLKQSDDETSDNIPSPDYVKTKKPKSKKGKPKPSAKKPQKKKKSKSEITPPIVVQGESKNSITKNDIRKVLLENLRE